MRLIDRYILLQTAKPLGISLAVVLVAMLLERILRLFDLLAQTSAAFGPILAMAANLVPHYLGLALPAAFFISCFLVAARFSEDNELDALRDCGLSIRRFSRPFLGLGAVLVLFSILLYGYMQPYSRYAYRAIFYAVTNASWDATVTEGTFINAGNGYTVFAEKVDMGGQTLRKVFVHETQPDGEVSTTAEEGALALSEDGFNLVLLLRKAVQIRTGADGQHSVLAFDALTLSRPFSREIPLFRSRGDDERELTMGELRAEWEKPAPGVPATQLRSEFNARIVRSLSLVFLPMLAVPMGVGAKRSRRWQGIVLAAVILVVYNHTLQFGESLADLGRADPILALWGPFLVFSTLCAAIYLYAERHPGADPFGAVFDWLDGLVARLGRLMPRGLLRKART
ncbi:LptF/LptG family permease [Azospirillum sp. SYSU D00513]|uniref:LptF/LptG family permease n=1 Tax=Azospirillum sp. SYSU D00513 TaxID=2812561 RepID=UPI001A9568A8|nr:LptF/LptG family permease [Azospirillum sp. SYSU D00513]